MDIWALNYQSKAEWIFLYTQIIIPWYLFLKDKYPEVKNTVKNMISLDLTKISKICLN